MSELDYVLKDVKITEKNTQIDFKKFYQFLKKLMADNGYFITEKEYIQKLKDDIRNKSIKFKVFKKVDSYSQFYIEIRIKLSNASDIEGKEGILYEGDISLTFECYIEKDYNNKWENNAFLKFSRTIYDYMFLGTMFTKYEKQIKDETYDLINKIKDYLGG